MEIKTISKHTNTLDDRDFDFLKREGLEHIKELSRKLWTDYNSHDPGITILEALCYAITDLGHRIQFPIADLLTTSKNGGITGDFPTAKSILTTSAVTEKDYRKLMIDIDGVKNAFIHNHKDWVLHRHCLEKSEPGENTPWGKLSYDDDQTPDYKKIDSFALKGLYDIYFEPEHEIQLLDKTSEERKNRITELTEQIKKRYHANRNLCEDLVKVKEVTYLNILVCGDIEIEQNANATEVMAEMMFRVKEYLSPTVKRFSLTELLNEGLGTESIYDGPVLQNGFIPDEELEKTAIRKEIYLSDLIRIVTGVPGVKTIKKLKAGRCDDTDSIAELEDTSKQNWKICLPDDATILPRLCLKQSITRTNLFKDVVPVPAGFDAVVDQLNSLIEKHLQKVTLSYDDIPIEPGIYTDIEHYRSVQNDLPGLYGTGEAGLSPSLPPERHAKAKQLKSYLLFFDQILASYFGHLRNLGGMLSSEVGIRSYFASAIHDVKDFDELLGNPGAYSVNVQSILENHDRFLQRKSEFLDHLLARFAENMNEYAFTMLENFGENLTNAALWHKSVLMKEYPGLSQNRARAFNYFDTDADAWNTFHVSGFKKRIARLLGIRNYSRRNLTETNVTVFPDEGDPDKWNWNILDEGGDPLISAIQLYDDQATAEAGLWLAVSAGWNPKNYAVNKVEGSDDYTLVLMSESGEIARSNETFGTEEEARNQVNALAEYMYNQVSDEGLFLFENILFRPDRDDDNADEKFIKICMDSECMQCRPNDPYSMRVTVVLPGWTRRFSNLYFREYAEKMIRKETPAHILCRICWIGNAIETEEGEWNTDDGPMQQLQDLYRKWITKKMDSPENQKENEFLKPLVDMLHDLETVYPEGKLFDCKTADSDDSDSSIILGKTTIGELKNKKNGDE